MSERIEITPELIERHMEAARTERAAVFAALWRSLFQRPQAAPAPRRRPAMAEVQS
jgi:hypothetical protein